ncbi:hypothetical protein CTZ35_07995 [Escherichia coli]|nr:hypothetical protein CTZ35_07995 [Escherichia coli]
MFHTIVSIKNDGHYFCRAGGNRPDGLNEPVTDNGTAILSHISLTRRWFSAHIKCPFSYCSYPCVSNKKNKMTHKTS